LACRGLFHGLQDDRVLGLTMLRLASTLMPGGTSSDTTGRGGAPSRRPSWLTFSGGHSRMKIRVSGTR
jgi:hypothetical protein